MPGDPQITHWADPSGAVACYREHHGCAVAEVEQLRSKALVDMEIARDLAALVGGLELEAARLREEREALALACRPDVALDIHVRHCPQCSGPNDGCDLGQRLEQAAIDGGWR